MEQRLGQIIYGAAERDAVHIAIAPVTSEEELNPGEHVGFLPSGYVSKNAPHKIGIVDPFLPSKISPQQRFYICLYPGSVTSLRHHWKHPSFKENNQPANITEAEEWLKDYVVRNCPYDCDEFGKDAAYERFIANLTMNNQIHFAGNDLHGRYELDREEELFEQLAIVLGRHIDPESLTYSCSC